MMAGKAGVVTQVTKEKIVVGDKEYLVTPKDANIVHSQFFPLNQLGKK